MGTTPSPPQFRGLQLVRGIATVSFARMVRICEWFTISLIKFSLKSNFFKDILSAVGFGDSPITICDPSVFQSALPILDSYRNCKNPRSFGVDFQYSKPPQSTPW